MRFDVITLFPELLTGYLDGSVLGRARRADLFAVSFTDPREFSDDPTRRVDDAPFGGGAGMVMCPEPLARAVEHVGLVLSGAATAAFEDGTVHELTAGQVFYVPAVPHDSWVVGDQPYVSLHFLGAEHYAR